MWQGSIPIQQQDRKRTIAEGNKIKQGLVLALIKVSFLLYTRNWAVQNVAWYMNISAQQKDNNVATVEN